MGRENVLLENKKRNYCKNLQSMKKYNLPARCMM